MATRSLEVLDLLRAQFSEQIALYERRPGLFQLVAPLYHEDGDMLSIFLQPLDDGRVRITDMADTVMRLSYTYQLDTANKERVFQRILAEGGLGEMDGHLFIDSEIQALYPSVLQFAQTVSKVTNMSMYRREVVENLFYELLLEFVLEKLGEYKPRLQVLPLEDHPELEVDYVLEAGPKPLFVFGIKDSSKAKLVTISCLQFQLSRLPFQSCAVHQDFDALTRRDRKLITSAIDKQFVSLDDFQENASPWLERLAA